MTVNRLVNLPRAALLGCALLGMAATGCQSSVGGQTLPSAFYLKDDVQYFPPGPDFILSNQVEAIEQYNLRRDGLQVEEQTMP